MKTCIIILNYNDWKTTVNLVENVIKYDKVENIVVVDNCSTDKSFIELCTRYSSIDKVFIIKSKRNGGYAYGNNYGIKFALKEFMPDLFIIANPDIYFSEKLINKMIKYYCERSDIGVLTCQMNCTSPINLPIAWKLPVYRDCIMENLIVLRKIIGDKTRYKKSYFEKATIKRVDVLPGSFFLISAKVLKLIDYFDEYTFLYYEENILSYKLKKLGYKNYLLLNDQYIHNHSISINKTISSLKNKLYIAGASRRYYCKKYLKVSRKQLILFDFTLKLGVFDYCCITKVLNCFRSREKRRI